MARNLPCALCAHRVEHYIAIFVLLIQSHDHWDTYCSDQSSNVCTFSTFCVHLFIITFDMMKIILVVHPA